MSRSFAIVIVCFKRLDGVVRLVSSLEKVNYEGRNDITLLFSIDRSEESSILEWAEQYVWDFGPKLVLARDEHLGLKKHILKCGDLTEKYDILVVLEDDVYVSNSMFSYASSAAEAYWDDDRIAGISLYGFQKNWLAWHYRFEPQRTCHDAYFMKIAQSWGQVWTYRKWHEFKEWLDCNPVFPDDDSIPDDLKTWGESSWLKYHDRYCMVNDKYFVYPYLSLSTNFSDAGEHSSGTTCDHQVELQCDKDNFSFPAFEFGIRYDEYMNREGLESYLNVDSDDLTVDFWRTKRESSYRRYVLTTKPLNYKVIASFELSLRPIELAVTNSLFGNGLWLYDTAKSAPAPKCSPRETNLLRFSLRTSDPKILVPYSIRSLLNKIFSKIKKK